MSIDNAYKNYFNIDENYYASVSEELLSGGFVDWTSFYPHETFIKLVKDATSVLRREQKSSIWVEGAYGTGKSHAVLTLKKILDASEDEVSKYFTDNNLDQDLFNKIQKAKDGKILTIHRVGSSSIKGDKSLVMAIQDSIKNEISEKGFSFQCEDSLKEAIIKWLSDEINAKNFNNYIEGRYKNDFGTDDAITIIRKLETLKEDACTELIRKIFMVAENEGIIALQLEADGLCKWIKSLIEKNEIKSMIFIWDEFTEYFKNNKNAITGFQTLAELSQTIPFHFIIVTHNVANQFSEKDDSRKILDRFIKPRCEINLPENMAFKLLGKAMKIKEDSQVKSDWETLSTDLLLNIPICRKLVVASAKVDEVDLKRILPIHPYTALILKHLSALFGSNQRSMFDYIKNKKQDDEDRSFSWFIENHGPYSDNNLLTIDMLWDYFYANGKADLESGLKSLLSVYDMRENSQKLSDDNRSVLKTILLLQGISEKNRDSFEIVKPTEKNIRNAFEGTYIGSHRAVQIAEILVKEGFIFKHLIGNNEPQFTAMRSGGNTSDTGKYIEEFRKDKKLKSIIEDYKISEFLDLPKSMQLRYKVQFATVDDITKIANGIRNELYENIIPLVVTFAKNDTDRAILFSKINDLSKSDEQEIVFVDSSLCDLSDEEFEEFIKNLAEEKYWRGKDNSLADQYKGNASDIIKTWYNKLATSEFRIIIKTELLKAFGINEVHNKLKEYSLKSFPMSIECFNVVGTMFDASSFKLGAKCGITEDVSGQFRSSNPATKLETALQGVWKLADGLPPNTSHLVYRIKVRLDEEINAGFDKNGKISIEQIYDFLKQTPYGFLPCNLTSFVLGFLLKDYANDVYRWSNEQVSEPLSVDKLAEMIEEILKEQNQLTKSRNYLNKYIVKMTPEEKAFLKSTSMIFDIREENCANIDKTREEVRTAIKKIGLPLWAINIYFNKDKPTGYQSLSDIIEKYCLLANNSGSEKSETDIALDLGKTFEENSDLTTMLENKFSMDNCKNGMISYLIDYKDGELSGLADKINCKSRMLADLKIKFSSDYSWLWSKDTIDSKIDELIVEYKIICLSNELVAKTDNFKSCIEAWVDKMYYFKLPYEGIKNDIGCMKPLFEMLFNIFKTETISDMQKENFYELLASNSKEFLSMFSDQISLFKKKYSFDLVDLSERDINKLFVSMPLGAVTKSNAEFQTIVTTKVQEYRKSVLIVELKELWNTKTSSSDPKDWSQKNDTPILCMIDESIYDDAKKAFEVLNQKTPTDSDVKFSLEFLKKNNIFESLKDEGLRNNLFMKKMVGNYSTIKDAIKTREILILHLKTCGVYDWYPKSKNVDDVLKGYAEKLYTETGCDEALIKIENMSETNAKQYLKRLVKESVHVGMEILKDE